MDEQQGWAAPGSAPGATPRPTDGPGSGVPDPSRDAQGAAAPAYAPAPRLEYRPGIVPLRPLTMGEIWRGVTTAVRGNPSATIGLALVVSVAVLLPLTALAIAAGATLEDALADSTAVDAAGLGATLASTVPSFALVVASVLLPVFMAVVVGQGVQGRRIGMGETWRAGRSRVWAAVGVLVLGGVALAVAAAAVFGVLGAVFWLSDSNGLRALLGFVLVVAVLVLAVVVSVRWAFATTVVVLEGLGPVKALRRSWRLVRGQGAWRIFGIRLLTGIVAGIVANVVSLPVALVLGFATGDPGSTATLWLLPAVQALSTLVQAVVLTPFTSGVDALLYIDQRFRYEGLDVALVQQLQGEGSAAR